MNMRLDLVGTLHQVAGDGVVAHPMAHNFDALDLLVFSWRGEARRNAHASRIHLGQCRGVTIKPCVRDSEDEVQQC